MSPTLKFNLTLFVILFYKIAIIDFQCCNYHHLLSDSSSKFQSSMTTFSYKNARMHNIPKVDEQKLE